MAEFNPTDTEMVETLAALTDRANALEHKLRTRTTNTAVLQKQYDATNAALDRLSDVYTRLELDHDS